MMGRILKVLKNGQSIFEFHEYDPEGNTILIQECDAEGHASGRQRTFLTGQNILQVSWAKEDEQGRLRYYGKSKVKAPATPETIFSPWALA